MYSNPTQAKSMASATQHPPVILLVGERSNERDTIDQWLADSRYDACEATNIFEALEQLSDFTVQTRPELVFVHVVSLDADLRLLQEVTATGVNEPDVPIITFGCDEARRNTASSLAGLACELDRYIPRNAPTS